MKYYLFQIACFLTCIPLMIWRPLPSLAIVIVSALIIVASIVLTKIGKDNAVEDMWWRMALAILAPLLIGLGGAN